MCGISLYLLQRLKVTIMDEMKKYTNAEVATIAVARLNGISIPLDLEDIAMELLRIAKPRFSLKKYPEHVDMHVVRVSLSDACETR